MSHLMREPFIIIEGPDCTGKTTLSKFLAKELNGWLFHATAQGRLKEAMQDYQTNILHNVETALYELDRAAILDRHWPSEAVYGPVFRPGNPHGFNYESQANRCRSLKAIYILCDRSDVIDAHAEHQDPDHPYDPDQFRRVVDGYRLLRSRMEEEQYPFIDYDCRQPEAMITCLRLIKLKNHEIHSNSK